MCSLQVKLTEQCTAAELAYRDAVARGKAARGLEFERAWRLQEHRRISLQRAQQILKEHERDHMCGSAQHSFASA